MTEPNHTMDLTFRLGSGMREFKAGILGHTGMHGSGCIMTVPSGLLTAEILEWTSRRSAERVDTARCCCRNLDVAGAARTPIFTEDMQ